MIESLSRPLVRSMVLIAACAAAFGAAAWARRPADTNFAAPAPTAIAIVDLEKVMNQLTELKDKNQDVESRGKQLQSKLDGVVDEVKAVDEQLKMVPTTEVRRRQDLILQKRELEASIETKKKVYQKQIDLDNGDVIRELYIKILAAVEAVSKKEGFDLVIVDDRTIAMPPGGTSAQYGELIQSRRVLYANEALNITDRVFTIMNNDYASGGTPKTNP